MAIYVSRYSNKGITNDSHYAVGISIGTPRFRTAYTIRQQCYSLAPKGYMLRMGMEEFRKVYFEKLQTIGARKIVDMVRNLEKEASSQEKDLVLLCFEDVRIEGYWCHRTMFADWWKKETGEDIKELPDPTNPKGKKKGGNENSETIGSDLGFKQMSFF